MLTEFCSKNCSNFDDTLSKFGVYVSTEASIYVLSALFWANALFANITKAKRQITMVFVFIAKKLNNCFRKDKNYYIYASKIWESLPYFLIIVKQHKLTQQ